MKILHIIFLTLPILFLSNQTTAQISIDGTITDSDFNPISNAFVEIIDQDDTTNFYSANTNESGYFSISNIFTDLTERKDVIPSDFIVLRNYPNPFNPSTIIYYELPKSENIEIKVYDILGREVKTLFSDFHKAGTFTLEWNGRNDWNTPVAAGVYFCRLKTKNNFKVHKMLLLDGGSHFHNKLSINLKRERSNELSKANGIFNYSIRVTGNDILESEFTYLSCSGDTTLNLTVPKILQRVTIGPQGGILESDDFSLAIPEGAIDIDAELLVFHRNYDEWDTHSTSKIVGIEGLPLNFKLPLGINFVADNITSSKSFIAIGQEYEIPSLNESQLFFRFLDTKDSSGILSSKLEPDTNLSLNNLHKISSSLYDRHKIYFSKQNGYLGDTTKNKHFAVFIHEKTPQFFLLQDEIQKEFEQNFDILTNMGFDTDKIKWPVEIYVKNCNPRIRERGCIYYPTFGSKNTSILVDSSRAWVLGFNSIREYAIGIFRSYDNKFFLPNEFTGKVDPARYWFHQAVASWFEGKQGNLWPMDYYSDFWNNINAPFNGIKAGAGKTSQSAQQHGGGVSSLIKYIENNYGEAPIVSMYEMIRDDESSVVEGNKMYPIEALKATLSDPYIWLPDYFEQYMEKKLYEFHKSLIFEHWDTGNVENIIIGSYKFKDKSDTLKRFENVELPALSAKGFNIEWDDNKIDTNRIIKLKLDDTKNTLIVYAGTAHESYSLLGKGKNFSMRISDILKLKLEEMPINHLVIVVTNGESSFPYTNKTALSLEIKLEKPRELKFKYCDIRLAVIEMHDTLEGVWSPGWYTVGSFKDNVFEGVINSEKQGGTATGTIRIELDDNQNILSLDVMAYDIDYSQWGFSATNIPPTENEPYLMVYSYLGYDVCNYVKSIYAKYLFPDGNELELKHFKCDPESNLHIKFHNWD